MDYQQDFPPSNPDLRRLAEQYHAECEAYDRTVCTGPIIDGAVMPMTPQERGLVVRNSQAVLRRVIDEGRRLGIDRQELWREIGRVS